MNLEKSELEINGCKREFFLGAVRRKYQNDHVQKMLVREFSELFFLKCVVREARRHGGIKGKRDLCRQIFSLV